DTRSTSRTTACTTSTTGSASSSRRSSAQKTCRSAGRRAQRALEAEAEVALIAWCLGRPGCRDLLEPECDAVWLSCERETGAGALADLATPFEPIPETSAAERVVADALAIGAPVAIAERVRDSVPLWFHT